jgi:probable HAF family extracellular repeat protein
MTLLGGLPGQSFSFTSAINDQGKIAGHAVVGGTTRAVIYEGASATDIGTLGGSAALANDVNNLGQVVGYSQTIGAIGHAFLYDGTMHDLGVPRVSQPATGRR